MYLKKVEFLGFKSFADRTVMNFMPGMTSIVGPNGCGKSNIADAVRWVLGEQSAKALRGGKMMDVIFNGADGFKPTNMAEVSLTLSDCEDVLKTDYHEVTVTRRLFRSGDSEYYLNKQACRLKDIHRLFMDTGVGRNSYSILEQGKIDQVLSSRPEDRRQVFEEASGITKFKADRREALRKLDHTEQNLTRLDDVVREVKRRMISLQRQAGKARRYKEIQKRLRGRDLWLSRHRLEEMREAIAGREVKLDELHKRVEARKSEIESEEGSLVDVRTDLDAVDKQIADRMEEVVNLRNELNQAGESVRVNTERIEEMRSYATRDSKDAEEARNRLEQHHRSLQESAEAHREAVEGRDESEAELKTRQEALSRLENTGREDRDRLRGYRARMGELEETINRTQGNVRDFEQRERGRMVQQERLREGIDELEKAADERDRKVQELEATVEELQSRESTLRERMEQGAARHRQHEDALKEKRRELGELDKTVAGLNARLDVLRAQEAEKEEFPSGARTLLSGEALAGLDSEQVLGALAQQVRTDRGHQTALESLLRSTLDAVVVRDASALPAVLDALTGQDKGAARVMAVEGVAGPEPVTKGPGQPFAGRVKCAEPIRALVDRLFAGVFLVEDVRSAPRPEPGQVFVDASGHIVRGDGTMEVYAEDQGQGNPLALQAKIDETETSLNSAQERAEDLRASLEAAQGEEAGFQERLKAAREELQTVHREQAGREAELRNAVRERDQGRTRYGQLKNQLERMDETHGDSDRERSEMTEVLETARVERDDLKLKIEEASAKLESAEQARNAAVQAATEARITFAEQRQRVDILERQQQNVRDRISELESTIQERNEGVNTYEQRVIRLNEDLESARGRIEPLKEKLETKNAEVSGLREGRKEKQTALRELESALRTKRTEVEELNSQASGLDVDLAQRRVRMENMVQRVAEAYHVTLPDIQRAEEPEWDGGEAPEWTELERAVNEMKDKLEKMGPVNMVAIEEYQEQEDRYQFLMAQQEDLTQAKDKLLETIRQINETTTEMFNKTFNKVNEHFQEMFKRLFGGGEAYLELVDEEDVLESGIDIVAKPPGKKPQVISLLSGGERTMTAVALLFALYSVKPSPFCILDELDAALDDANIGRFVALVQSFLKDSQFIVITHNQKTIAAADVLYGVTQERKGVSKVVSVKLTDHDKDPEDVAKSKQQLAPVS